MSKISRRQAINGALACAGAVALPAAAMPLSGALTPYGEALKAVEGIPGKCLIDYWHGRPVAMWNDAETQTVHWQSLSDIQASIVQERQTAWCDGVRHARGLP